MTPTARTLAECRKRGWIAQVVERTVPRTFIKQDLFGCIDIVALVTSDIAHERCANGDIQMYRQTPGIIGIQATATSAHHAHRRTKILAEPRIKAWIEAGGRMEIWSWSKQGARGKRKRWTLRVEPIVLADYEHRAGTVAA